MDNEIIADLFQLWKYWIFDEKIFLPLLHLIYFILFFENKTKQNKQTKK